MNNESVILTALLRNSMPKRKAYLTMTQYLKIIALSLSLLLVLVGCGADAAMKKGDKFYALGEYYDAATQYKKAYSATPAKDRVNRGKRALKLADCYRRINYTQRAIAAYQNVVRYKQTDSLTLLYLGQQLLKNGNYKEAAKYFQQLVDSMPHHRLAQAGLASALQAPQWKKEGSAYTVKKENFFNSRRADYSPVLAGDNYDQLYFTSTRNQVAGDELSGITGTKNGDIMMSVKNEKGKPRADQIRFHEMLTKREIIHGIARSAGDAVKIVEEGLIGYGFN